MRTQRERTIRNLNMHICATWECDDNGWPIVRPSYAVPERLTTFQVSNAKDNSNAFCHFFIDDYRFERLWTKPERYVPIIGQYAGALSPDFSTYTDMPWPMQQWNIYRSRMLMQYWQDNGIEVIPTVQWCDERTVEASLEGLPKGGTVAVGTAGIFKSQDGIDLLHMGLERILDEIDPETVLMYGKEHELGIDPRFSVVWYANDNHERVVRNAGHRDRSRDGRR